MKKIISVLLSVLMVTVLFTACSSKPTEKIDVRQAQHLIESYSVEELGLTNEQIENAKYLRCDKTKMSNDVEYYEILIAKTVEMGETNEEGQILYSFDTIGTYYVTLDGKEAFSVDNDTAELTKLPKKEVPQLTPEDIAEMEIAQNANKEQQPNTHVHVDDEGNTHVHTVE